MTGHQLNEKIWKLFTKAGFNTKPNENDPSEHEIKLSPRKIRTPDLLAIERNLRVRIIGENKTGKERENNTKLINDFAELIRIDKAQAGLIVSIKEEFKPADVEYAATKNIYIWDKDKLKYYETLVDTLGEYSKYEIIHSFNITTREQKFNYDVLALKFQQPYEGSAANVFVFTMPPEQLLKTCVIYRRAQGNSDAYQRMVKKKRLKSIRDFVSKENALLPTNILVYFNEAISYSKLKLPQKDQNGKALNLTNEIYELVNLEIPLKYGSMEILDGQHRLYGFLETEPATKKEFNLIVVGIEGLESVTKRDTFIAINDNARRMDPNLVAFLKYNSDEDECQNDNEIMAIKVVFDLNKDSNSPFKDRIRMLDLGDQIITLKGFAGYDLKGLLGKTGLLRKYYNNISHEYVSILKDYFNTIKSSFDVQYKDPTKYIIFTNKGISAFLKLLKSILKHEKKKLSKQDLADYVSVIRKNTKDKDWEINSLKSKYVGSQGWKEFHRYLVGLIKTEKPDFAE